MRYVDFEGGPWDGLHELLADYIDECLAPAPDFDERRLHQYVRVGPFCMLYIDIVEWIEGV